MRGLLAKQLEALDKDLRKRVHVNRDLVGDAAVTAQQAGLEMLSARLSRADVVRRAARSDRKDA